MAELAAHWQEFGSPEALAGTLAGMVSRKLAAAIAERGQASLAVSGGTTPVRFFEALAGEEIPWKKVWVTLVDERMVPASSDRSNAGLAMRHLLYGQAAAAKFVPLYRGDNDPKSAAEAASDPLEWIAWPLDVVVLGMGLDGHTASYFPDAPNVDAIFDLKEERIVIPVEAPSAIEPRLTLALPRVAEARSLYLHIEGNAKRELLVSAMKDGTELPIVRTIKASRHPVEICWAP